MEETSAKSHHRRGGGSRVPAWTNQNAAPSDLAILEITSDDIIKFFRAKLCGAWSLVALMALVPVLLSTPSTFFILNFYPKLINITIFTLLYI